MEKSDMSLISKEITDMISDESNSNNPEVHSISSAFDANNRISVSEDKSSCSKPEDDPPQVLSLNITPPQNYLDLPSKFETPRDPLPSFNDEDEVPSSSNDNSMEWSLPSGSNSGSEVDYGGDEDLERFVEQEMRSGINSDIKPLEIEGFINRLDSPSSSSTGDMYYYGDDEDMERFCNQEMNTSKGINSGIEPLKIADGKLLERLASQSFTLRSCGDTLDPYDFRLGNEDLERFYEQEMITSKRIGSDIEPLQSEDGKLLESLASSNNETGTPTTTIKPIGAERKKNSFVSSEASYAVLHTQLHTSALNEPDLLMQVSKFFAKNPIVGEVVDRNELVASRYFTDEFALQHGLTLDKNNVSIRNELEQRVESVMETSKTKTSWNKLTIEKNEEVSMKNESEQDDSMESSEDDFYSKRWRELLAWRPLCILMTLFKFYLNSRYSY